MRFTGNHIANYLASTPLALALERGLECLIVSKQQFIPPVLDIGCGDGLFASILFADKVDTGIDLDPSEIAQAKKSGAYQELICCSGSEIPKPSESYRTILSNSVLEHIPDVTSVLREAYRLLEPGGNFYFTVPTDKFEQYSLVYRILCGIGLGNSAARYRKWYNRFWRHFHAYGVSEWKQLAVNAGFEVVKAIRYNPPAMTTRNDLLVPVAILSTIVKRMTGRWVVWPRLRKVVLAPITPRIQRDFVENGISADGSLVLIQAHKVLKTVG